MANTFRNKRCHLSWVLLVTIWSLQGGRLYAQSHDSATPAVFEITQPDHRLSPLTGITRRHWKDAARYLLDGAFSYVHSLQDPLVFPKQPGKSYPRNPAQLPTEKLEGLCRTLLIAAPLLREDSNLVCNKVRLLDYYRYHIKQLTDSNSKAFIPLRAATAGPSQVLVELGALSLSMFAIPELLWDPLPAAERASLASLMLSYADGPTIASNWRFFNIFILSFFEARGYVTNRTLLQGYLQESLQHYRGAGWYHDAPAYDYYSMWGFQMYAIMWCQLFGDQFYPDYASSFRKNFEPLKENYPKLFGRDGNMIMWGRSISYRICATIPLALTALEKNSNVNFGWMRRISSGVLLQFLQHPKFLSDRVPTLGFYGAFEPAVQSYSCRGSVYWMGKAFFSLLLPEQSPYWTAVENDGPWRDSLLAGRVYNSLQDTTGMLVSNYPDIGAAEIRAWCHVPVLKANEPFRGSENYNRLSYNSAFPWQADSSNGTVAMNYLARSGHSNWEPFHLYTFKKFVNGIYYRDVRLEGDSSVQVQLAEMPLHNGILRIDRALPAQALSLRLGHYALPVLDRPMRIIKKASGKHHVTIIDNGVYQLALVPLHGWQGVEVRHGRGIHPAAAVSDVLNVSTELPASKQPAYLATLLLWKRSGEAWTDKDFNPVHKLTFTKRGAVVSFADGLPVHFTY